MSPRDNNLAVEKETRTEKFSTSDLLGRPQTVPEQQATQTEMPSQTGASQTGASQTAPLPLFTREETQNFKTRWKDVQTSFVDEPRHAVEDADGLVAELMRTLAQSFASERTTLENQWNRGDNVSTEDLRVSLQRYRSFFDRLLSM